MPGHLSPDNATRNSMCNERGSSTRVLLLVLLLVAAAGGYLYFFTDLIRPVKEAAKPPVTQTAQVKQPIPPRPGQPGGPEAVVPKPEEAKPSQGAPPPPAPAIPQAKQATEQKAAPSVAPPAKPEPAKLAKAEAPQKPATAAAPAAAPAKPAAAKPKPAAAAKATPAAPARPVPKVAKRAVKGKRGAYSLQVGDFVPDKAFEAVQAKLKKSGIVPVRMTAITAPEPMKRLAVAQFTDQDAAEAELQKLKKLIADAFLVADDGTYSLYAGSYFTDGRLHYEQRRLAAKGIKTVVKKVQVPIKVMRVSAGSYASAAEARNDQQCLKKLGLTAKVVMAGKK
jgi:hypothetical protein